jgi:hypothetical protein
MLPSAAVAWRTTILSPKGRSIMQNIRQIGSVPWTNEDLTDALEQFKELYECRPVRDNVGGMRAPHLFYTWFLAKFLAPGHIVESGVFKGQGTWVLQQAAPGAEFYCIDPNQSVVEYRHQTAKYLTEDFTCHDWSALPAETTLLFFDDHQNAYQRLIYAKWLGFRHLIFEDNYPASQGDCYSLKKAFMHSGLLYPQAKEKVAPNDIDEKYILKNVEVYYEFPPVFKLARTRWGDDWKSPEYPTPEALLDEPTKPFHDIYHAEADSYTWLCYVKLY